MHQEFIRKDLRSAHPCVAPGLSAIEFLHAVYNDHTLPIDTRIKAASALLPYSHSAPRPTNSFPPRCKIIIGGLGPFDPGAWPMVRVCPSPGEPKGEANESTGNHSQNLDPASKTIAQVPETGDPENIEMNSPPQTFPDYSIPPTPAEIQEMKAVILALQPDADLSNLPEPRLCECGHWMFYPCKCVSIN